jgi:crossover junction endodeoxyribonuclease RuvC
MRIFSIDPGLTGAFAVVVDGRPTLCGDMPTSGEGTKRRVQASVLANIMRGELPDLCVVELVNAMPYGLHGRKQGAASTFRFGMSYGAALAVPAIVGVPVELVTPSLWKLHHGLRGQDKEASRQKALDLCPWLSASLDRKKDDGRAEAVLIGLYAAATWDHDHSAYPVRIILPSQHMAEA